MELRSVEELMDLLYACRGSWDAPGLRSRRVDLHQHALQTAALLRRRRPADKELQVAGLVHVIGPLLRPGDESAHPGCAADAVRPCSASGSPGSSASTTAPTPPTTTICCACARRTRRAAAPASTRGYWRTGARSWNSSPHATPASGLLTDGPS